MSCLLLSRDITIGIPQSDVEVRDFYLDKSVVPVTAGTVITVTLKHLAATLMTGLTLKGIACTDRTVTGANTLTFVAPALTAGIGNVVGSFTGYDDFPIYNGITAQVGASAPGTFTLSVLEWGANRARLSWTPSSGAESFGIYRNDTLIQTITTSFFYVDKPTAGTIEYYVKATNGTGSTDSNTVEIVIGLGGIERRAWQYFKDTMQTDPDLLAYITTWKFNLTQQQFDESNCPVFVAYVDTEDPGEYLGVPKQRTDEIVVKVSGKVASSGDDAITEQLKINELIKNALEKNLQLVPAWFKVSFGQSKFTWLNDQVQEVNIDVRLQLPRFTAGTR